MYSLNQFFCNLVLDNSRDVMLYSVSLQYEIKSVIDYSTSRQDQSQSYIWREKHILMHSPEVAKFEFSLPNEN